MDNQHQPSQEFLEDAIRMARKAGAVLKHRLKTDFSVEFKGEVDLVTEMDRAAQDIIQEEILENYPEHGILAEEDLDDDAVLFVTDVEKFLCGHHKIPCSDPPCVASWSTRLVTSGSSTRGGA